MNKKEYWEAHVKKNKTFADETKEIRISVGSLRKLMEEAFDKGYDHHKSITDVFRDVFKDVRGKRGPF